MREVCNAEWDDIQERLREKDAQIERLKEDVRRWEIVGREADAEIEQLKALFTRAADALEKYTLYPLGMVMSVTLRESGRSLIAELRKAAE
jgi:multidrug resistance efflux pump